ncbi:low affinity iron permease family protein [Nonomuraea sp. NPDC049646]|uniref:low affinity iron permease family protein n=1 Tax=unclassified Nonomuraea TaxID=2593643 RepID=UPI0037BB1BCD
MPYRPAAPVMPTQVDGHLGVFDRFASAVARFTSKPWFFALCVVLVVVWAPSYLVIGDVNTWQLIINSLTTIVTFLLVALIQNTQTRADAAAQHKLNAIACALAVLMADSDADARAVRELRHAVGLEERESA